MIKFGTQSISAVKLGTTTISKVCVGSVQVFPVNTPIDYTEPFYVQNDNNYDIDLLWDTNNGTGGSPFSSMPSVFYSTNRNTPLAQWTEVVWDYNSETGGVGATVTVPANSKMYMYLYLSADYKGLESLTADGTTITALTCPDQENYSIGGNAMSLLYGQDFTGSETAFPTGTTHNLSMVFTDPYLVDAGNLLLPATTLTDNCYDGMFTGSYIVTAPELPATTLAQGCYSQMFTGCPYLNSITVGATSWDTSYSSGWVSGVSATGTFTKPSTTTIATGDDGIPSGWTVNNV